MSRRIAIICLSVLLGCLIGAPAALGWDNGGGNGYGTHDWILDQAMKLAEKAQPGVTSWIDKEDALHATDDPDTLGTNVDWHLFRDVGTSRGGPQKIADTYYEATRALQAGDAESASVKLGVLSHYYGDMTQPFHTTWAGFEDPAKLHSSYELWVDRLTRESSDEQAWAASAGRQPMTDVRARAISAAYYSRARFDSLYKAIKANHAADTSNPTANKITGECLRKAVNDLADLIVALPHSEGFALAPAQLKATINRTYPGRGRKVCAYATATDAGGKGIEGVAVVFAWPMPDGSIKKQTSYTDAHGIAHDWKQLGAYSYMKWRTITVSSGSSGASTEATTSFMVTPPLHSGSKGIKTSVSNHHPRIGQIVSASTKCRARNGKPVAGLPVTFTWVLKSGTVTLNAVTNSRGVARRSLNIGKAKGYRAMVRARTIADSTHRSSASTFVPR